MEDIRTNGITDPDPEVVAAINDHFEDETPTPPAVSDEPEPADEDEDDEPVVPLSREDILEDIRTNGITDPDPEVVAAINDHFEDKTPTSRDVIDEPEPADEDEDD